VAAWAPEGREELIHIQSRRDGLEEIPLVRGKVQRLHLAGAAGKRYSTTKWNIRIQCSGEEGTRWRRDKMARPLSPPQIHRKNI